MDEIRIVQQASNQSTDALSSQGNAASHQGNAASHQGNAASHQGNAASQDKLGDLVDIRSPSEKLQQSMLRHPSAFNRQGTVRKVEFLGVKSKISDSVLSTVIKFHNRLQEERGDVPGWVLVVLMTTGLVTGIWTVAEPRLSSILKNSLDNMNSIR